MESLPPGWLACCLVNCIVSRDWRVMNTCEQYTPVPSVLLQCTVCATLTTFLHRINLHFGYFTQKAESIIIHPWMQKMDKYSSTLTWEWIINHTIYPLFWIFLLIVKENIYFQRNDITTSKSSKERTSGLIKHTWLKYTLIV